MASGKKETKHMNDQSKRIATKIYLPIVNRVPFVSCCTYQWAKDKTCPIKGYFRVAKQKLVFSQIDHVAARQIGVNRESANRGIPEIRGF